MNYSIIRLKLCLMSIFLQQLPNFPAFTWSPDVLNPILLRLRLKQTKLLERMETLQPEFKMQSHNEIMRLEVVSNLQIENQVELEKKEALRLIYSNPSNTDLNLERLKELYKALNALFNFQVVDNQQFSSDFDNKNLLQFLTWFNKPGLDRLLKAGIAHLWFFSIAPFEKGAGVIARIISDIQLAKADGTTHRYYSVSDQISKKKEFEAEQRREVATRHAGSMFKLYLAGGMFTAFLLISLILVLVKIERNLRSTKIEEIH